MFTRLLLPLVTVALLLAGLGAPARSQGVNLPPLPYAPGQSIGPLQPPAHPQLEFDRQNYAQAYWHLVDTQDPTALQGFVPSSPLFWPPSSSGTTLPADADPFAEGRVVFEEFYAHRLQLDPQAGPPLRFGDLIWSDPLVGFTWRHWTRTSQFITATWIDPIAHQRHLDAMTEALTVGVEWETRGIPLFDLVQGVLVSEASNRRGGAAPPPVAPLPLAGLPAATQACDARIRQLAGTLAGIAGLRDEDGWWFGGHVGFDCDDYADAIGARIVKGQAGMSATTARVTFTDGDGVFRGHRVTKIRCGAHYWVVDGQTGAVSGPHANATPLDARPVMGGYDIDPARPVTSTDDNRALGTRNSLLEPPAWHTDPTARTRFQNVTGLDPADFTP